MDNEESADILEGGAAIYSNRFQPQFCLASFDVVKTELGRFNLTMETAMVDGQGAYVRFSSCYSLSAIDLEGLSENILQALYGEEEVL